MLFPRLLQLISTLLTLRLLLLLSIAILNNVILEELGDVIDDLRPLLLESD